MKESDCLTCERIVELLVAAFEGTLDTGESKELARWLDEREENRALFDALHEDAFLRERLLLYRRFDPAQDWWRVDPRRRARRRLMRWWAVGTTGAVLVAGIAWVFSGRLSRGIEKNALTVASSVLPGTYKALLTLEAGQTFVLGAHRDSTVTLPGEVVEEDDSRLSYREAGEKVTWHLLEVPRGGEYCLELSDGTLITLNAESRIHYPNRFDGVERVVELEGEAFFNVTRQAGVPFVVSSGESRVLVEGTSFNLKVYPGERQQATLLAGHVTVAWGEESVSLHPGEQLTWDEKGGEWSVRQVDVTPYIAWMEQRFVFDDELLEDVLRKLERWYDINVYIRYPSLLEIRYTGNLPKYEEIGRVLHLLELASHAHFSLHGRTLFVEKE